ncbi:hypothetical protein BDN71DRAFT_938127 [Pleurotus eryngii]|uniref:Secreted protein n=1 Tax=Pleurotus eryngii TaxID=5323 RepID=A0A9P6DF26_PLEER|nr:hypothetical protein BDN71DRAFT_938127 [Pleurotus eryngii]
MWAWVLIIALALLTRFRVVMYRGPTATSGDICGKVCSKLPGRLVLTALRGFDGLAFKLTIRPPGCGVLRGRMFNVLRGAP